MLENIIEDRIIEELGDDPMVFNLQSRLVDSLQGRGMSKDEVVAVVTSVLNQITTLAIAGDYILFPDGSTFFYRSGTKQEVKLNVKQKNEETES